MSKPQWDAGYVPAASVKELLNYFEREIQKHHALKSAVHSKRLGNSRRHQQQSRAEKCCKEKRVPSSLLQLSAWQRSERSLSACSIRNSEANSYVEQSHAQRPPSSDKTSACKFHSSSTPRRVTRVAKRSSTPVREHACGYVQRTPVRERACGSLLGSALIGSPVSPRLSPRFAEDGLWILSNKGMGFKSESLRESSASKEGLQSPYLYPRHTDDGQRLLSNKGMGFRPEPLRALSASREGPQSPYAPSPGLSPRATDDGQQRLSNKGIGFKRDSSASREGLQSPYEPSSSDTSQSHASMTRTGSKKLAGSIGSNLAGSIGPNLGSPTGTNLAGSGSIRINFAGSIGSRPSSPMATARSQSSSAMVRAEVNALASSVQGMRAAQNQFSTTEPALFSLATPTGAWGAASRTPSGKPSQAQAATSSTSPRIPTGARWRCFSGQRSTSFSAIAIPVEPTTHQKCQKTQQPTLIWEPPKKDFLFPERRLCCKAASAPAGEMVFK